MYKYKTFSKFTTEDLSLEERKTQGGWFLPNSRPFKTWVLT